MKKENLPRCPFCNASELDTIREDSERRDWANEREWWYCDQCNKRWYLEFRLQHVSEYEGDEE